MIATFAETKRRNPRRLAERSRRWFWVCSLIALGLASPLLATPPREGHTKVIIAKHLFPIPNASAEASIITSGGGEIVQEYETGTLVSFLTDSLKSLAERAKALEVEFHPHDEYDRIFLPEGTIDARKGVAKSLPEIPLTPSYQKGESGAYLLQFIGPILPEWVKQVESLGVKLVQYISYNAFIAGGTPGAVATVTELPFVQLADVFHVALKTHPRPGKGQEASDLIIRVIDAPGVEATVSAVEARAIGKSESRRTTKNELAIHGTFSADDIGRFQAYPLVYSILEEPVVSYSDERVSLALTSNISNGAPTNPGGYKSWLLSLCPFCTTLQADHFWFGEADSGLDDGTNDPGARHNPAFLPLSSSLPPRVRFGSNFEVSGAPPVGTFGHGSFVAGVAAGDPAADPAADQPGFLYGMGVAPSAGIFVTKINTTALTPVDSSAHDAANPASGDTVRVQNHSYNQYYQPSNIPPQLICYGGVYSSLSKDFDSSVFDADNGHFNGTAPNGTTEPMVLTVSAGNEDQQINNDGACSGSYGWVLPPATAKNVISVGSAEMPRSSSELWECMFCGQTSINNVAANSLRGTGLTGWFKPDLFAAVESLVSTRSMASSVGNLAYCSIQLPPPAGLVFPSGSYIASGGTSWAAPVAAGAALLARRFYEEVVHPGCHATTAGCDPTVASPALTKAMLIAGARSMAGGTVTTLRYDSSSVPKFTRELVPGLIGPFPNNQQGFGRISLEDVLAPYPFRYFVNETESVAPGSEWPKTLTIHDRTLPVKLALVWTDPPADAAMSPPTASLLVNNLNLRVELPTAPCVRYVGNRLNISNQALGEESENVGCSGGVFDTMNNVEIIRFFAPAGVTTFNVYVANVNAQGNLQNFALVAYNAYDSSVPPIAVPTMLADTPSANSIALSWSAVSGAVRYEIRRKSGSNPYGPPIPRTTTSFTDTGVSQNTAYLYQVRAVGSPFTSAWSAPDLATTAAYAHAASQNHLTVGSVIAATDLMELRTLVNSVRSAADLPVASFTDNPLVAGVTRIKGVHLTELRNALNEARVSSTLGLSALTYSDTGLPAVPTQVKAIHINELRDGVQ